MNSEHCTLLQSVGCLLIRVCAGQGQDEHPAGWCGPRCRVLPDGRPTAASECQESRDCGDHRGGVCETASLAGWANCNLDYRDGCETHSVDGRCESDESVVSDPLASINCQLELSLAEPYDCTRMSPLKAAADEALGECYQSITREQPHPDHVAERAVTVAADVQVETVVLLESGPSNAALDACAREATTTLRSLPAESVTTYAIRAVFTSD